MAKRRRSAPAKKTAKSAGTRERAPEASAQRATTIVGIGASAGGLEAVSQLLDALPARSGVALVVVQHLAPGHDSSLPELLGAHTAMPVIQVRDGTRIERDHVYVIPPNVHMVVDDGMLALLPRPTDATQHTPIDTFFTSLAAVEHSPLIAVVMSGTASDGAMGIRDVKAAGGITIAQEPASAKYDSMPRAAMATGMVDLVMTPAEIGGEIAHMAAHPFARKSKLAHDELGLRDDEQLKKIFELLRGMSGVDFRHYKMPTIRRRLLRRMALHRLTDIDPYITLLQTNPQELRGLFQDLLIHVTRFFREPESFDALVEEVFPTLLKDRDGEQPIRMWVCGCATGEEAYSLAITLVEYLQRAQVDARVQIFATDVSDAAIEHARAGIYPAAIAPDVGPERLRRFFTKTDGGYRVSKSIRDLCVFARQDLTKDPPFSRLDLVMCRNVLIYLDTTLQRKLIALFHYALNAHGYLVLGQAETVGAQATLFSTTGKRSRIHRKKTTPGEVPRVGFHLEHPAVALRKPPPASHAAEHGLEAEVSRAILDRYAPAGVVVDGDMQIVQFRGQTGPFLEPAPGEASLNLLKMAREGLLYGLRATLNSARKTKAPIRKDRLQVKAGHGWKPVSIEVIPLTGLGRPHFLVLFEEPEARHARSESTPKHSKKKTPASRIAVNGKLGLLQRELAASREYMQSIIQELEAANEQLQSANEEILSSNEELQSTNEELDTAKEELQSTNEELNMVNEELHGRNEEMGRINSDLVNLVGSVQIAIVIVNSDLRIRRFTPMAEKILNLIPADLDRSITHINPNIDCSNLEQLIIECMDSVAPVERDVQDRQGRWYSLRIRPYKNVDNKIDGAVLALFDIDVLKKSEQQAALAHDFADAVLHFTTQPVAVLNASFEIHKANAAFAEIFHLNADDLRGRPLLKLVTATEMDAWRGPYRLGALLAPLTAVTPRGETKMSLAGRVVASIDGGPGQMILVTASAADA
jgi:two-component system, chemotaxis family, CheB/CheR fusion protein